MHPSSASHGQYNRSQRYSVDLSPKHQSLYDSKQNKMVHHDDSQYYHGTLGQTTPVPYTVREPRPHSRLSAPDPIPVPFQKSLYVKPNNTNNHHHHNNHHHQPLLNNHTHDSPLVLSPADTPSPTNHHDILQEDNLGYHSNKRRPTSLKNSGKKSLSGPIDTQLDGAIHGSIPWKGKVQVAPYRRSSIDTTPPIGWTSQTQFTANNQKGGKPPPADIQSLMPQEGTHRLIDSILRSSNSTEIKPEMFSHHNEGSGPIRDRLVPPRDHLSPTRLSSEISDNLSVKRSHRSSSARQPHRRHTSHSNEMTSSVKHFGELEPLGPINGLKYPSSVHNNKGELLPNIIDTLPSNKV